MNNKEVDCYLEFYRQSMQAYYARAAYEWKFNFALWAGVAILVGFRMKGEIHSEINNWVFAAVHFAVFVLYTFLWSAKLHARNQEDRACARAYKQALEVFITGKVAKLQEVTPPPRTVRLEGLANYSAATQVLITGGLLGLNVWVSR